MRIPKRFKLLGQTIEVVFVPALAQETDHTGEACFRTNKILLQPDIPGYQRKKELIEHTFCHELMHHVMYYAESAHKEGTRLHQNEDFIDLSAGLLHQALTTMEYEDAECQSSP